MDYVYQNGELYLAHHGILGMHWGIRRFQNKDGSLTAVGRKRYGSKDGDSKKFDEQNNSPKSEHDTAVNSVKNEIKDCISSFTGSSLNKAYKQRCIAAADLGIEALKRSGHLDEDVDGGDFRDWFLFEDQTIGCTVIADLINQGYTAKKCSDIVSYIEKTFGHDGPLYKTGYDDKAFTIAERTIISDILNGGPDGLKAFARDCEKVKMENNEKLYHHGIKGQKWGVRRYQNEDGSLTAAGRKRYGVGFTRNDELVKRDAAKGKLDSDKLKDYDKKYSLHISNNPSGIFIVIVFSSLLISTMRSSAAGIRAPFSSSKRTFSVVVSM